MSLKVNNAKLNKIRSHLVSYTPTKKINLEEYNKKKDLFLKELQEYSQFITLLPTKNYLKNRTIKQKQNFYRETEKLILHGFLLEKLITNSTMNKKLKDLFRNYLAVWAYQSKIIKRGFKKPRGYAGDYKTIEMFYDQKICSKNIGYFFDYYILNNTLAKADISRKDKMIELFRCFVEQKRSLPDLKILNFGCGGCKDLRDMFKEYYPPIQLNITAVDQDLEALNFSRKFVRNFPKNVSVQFQKQEIIKLLKRHRNCKVRLSSENFELIYSIGLVDYFSDNVLRLFVRFCLASLVSGGQLIFAHKNSLKWRSFLAPDWLCNWRFYQRNKKRVLAILKHELRNHKLRIKWEKTGHMFFFIITKNR